MNPHSLFSILLVFATPSVSPYLPADDWPQWQGPARDNISRETGLLDSWPEGGPPLIWSVSNLGRGYGSVSVRGDRIFVQGSQGDESIVLALERSSGQTSWTRPLGPGLDQNRGGGPRGTPTLDGNRLYALTENGDLASLSTEDGSVVWKRNILTEFDGGNPRWRISESPLVDGERLIVTPGGSDAGVVALDKRTGQTLWTSAGLSDPAGYSSCLAVEVDGLRLILAFTARAAVGLRASDGQPMWRYEPVANRTANITTPIFHDNKVFFTSAYGTGAALLELKRNGDSVSAEEIYFTRNMQNHHGGVVLLNGSLYGFSNAILTCLDFETGERRWRDRSVGKGALTYADGHLYLLGEKNVVGLAEATAEGYREKGRFTIQDQGLPSWAHPVVSGATLYIRNQGVLAAYDVKAK